MPCDYRMQQSQAKSQSMLVILETIARLPLEDYEGLLGIVQGKAPLSHGLNGAYVECVLQL